MTEIELALEEWGLKSKEIKVYLALLELGESTTIRLSEITEINRTTLYDILTSLIENGIVGSIIKEKVRFFYAAKPQTLIAVLKEKENSIKKVLPSLMEKQGIIGKRPKIEFYEGAKGIDAIHQDVISTAKEILSYGSYSVTSKSIEYQALDFRKKRVNLKIPLIAICDNSVKEIEMLHKPEYKKFTKLYTDSSLNQMPTWTYIYGNKIATLSFEKEQFFGFIIESKSIAEKERFIFQKLLKGAKLVRL